MVEARRGNILGVAATVVIGLGLAVALSFDILEHKIPYLLDNFDTVLDSSVRYKSTNPLGLKDWHNDFLIEQNIWTTEANKIKFGMNGAKPDAFKRDYLLYLGESYFRDEPHFMEAKATYLAAQAEPRIAHEKGYDMTDAEINRKLAYCCLRLGQYVEAENYMRQAMADTAKTAGGVAKKGQDPERSYALDFLCECALRQNKLDEARAFIKERLATLKIGDAMESVEQHLVFNSALLREKEGKNVEAENLYKKLIDQLENDDKNRAASVGTASDNNRMLATTMREYARFLRRQKRSEESYKLMDRACDIMNNAP